jgi:hypothetical protein
VRSSKSRVELISDGLEAEGLERVHLVLHQRDQGRDHEDRARQDAGGKLVGQRLPGPGGHDRDAVPPGQHGVDDLALPRAELAKAEDLVEDGGGVGGDRGRQGVGHAGVGRGPFRRWGSQVGGEGVRGAAKEPFGRGGIRSAEAGVPVSRSPRSTRSDGNNGNAEGVRGARGEPPKGGPGRSTRAPPTGARGARLPKRAFGSAPEEPARRSRLGAGGVSSARGPGSRGRPTGSRDPAGRPPGEARSTPV